MQAKRVKCIWLWINTRSWIRKQHFHSPSGTTNLSTGQMTTQHHSLCIRRDIWRSSLPPSHSMQGSHYSSINWLLKTSKCGKSPSSPTILTIHPNTQSAAPKPQHGAPGPWSTRCHYQEELQKSSCWELLFKNLEFEEVSRGAPGLPLPTAPWELHVSWTAHHPGSAMLEALPSFSLLELGTPTLDAQSNTTKLSCMIRTHCHPHF